MEHNPRKIGHGGIWGSCLWHVFARHWRWFYDGFLHVTVSKKVVENQQLQKQHPCWVGSEIQLHLPPPSVSGFIASILKRRAEAANLSPRGFGGEVCCTTFLMRRYFPVNFRCITTVPLVLNRGPLEMAEKIWVSPGFLVHISGVITYNPIYD